MIFGEHTFVPKEGLSRLLSNHGVLFGDVRDRRSIRNDVKLVQDVMRHWSQADRKFLNCEGSRGRQSERTPSGLVVIGDAVGEKRKRGNRKIYKKRVVTIMAGEDGMEPARQSIHVNSATRNGAGSLHPHDPRERKTKLGPTPIGAAAHPQANRCHNPEIPPIHTPFSQLLLLCCSSLLLYPFLFSLPQ